jgi:hypothetical protein
MKTIKQIIREEINDFDWTSDIPTGINQNLYSYLTQNLKLKERRTNLDIDGEPIIMRDFEYDDPEYNTKEYIRVTYRNKKSVENDINNFIEDLDIVKELPNDIIKRTIRKFLNDTIYKK